MGSRFTIRPNAPGKRRNSVKAVTMSRAKANLAWYPIQDYLEEGNTVEQAAAKFGRRVDSLRKLIYCRTGSSITYP